MFTSNEFWEQLRGMSGLLDPLCETLAICEDNLSQAYYSLIQFGKICYEQSHKPIMAWGCFSLMAYINKLNEDPIYIAAYMLDPRYKRQFVTKDGYLHGIQALTDIAIGMNMSIESCRAMFGVFEDNKLGQFDLEEGISCTDPLNYWREVSGVSILKIKAIRLMSLKSSSSNVERLFSVLKNIQSPVSNRLSIRTLRRGNVSLKSINIGIVSITCTVSITRTVSLTGTNRVVIIIFCAINYIIINLAGL